MDTYAIITWYEGTQKKDEFWSFYSGENLDCDLVDYDIAQDYAVS
jgi:hypothetical protein